MNKRYNARNLISAIGYLFLAGVLVYLGMGNYLGMGRNLVSKYFHSNPASQTADVQASSTTPATGPQAPPPSAAYFAPPGITEGPLVSFNFDDGFDSAFNIGMSIVEAAGFKTTHYIPINRIGQPTYMDWEEILELQTRGHEIGAHTRTHVKLTDLSLEDARKEIAGSKQDLYDRGVAKVITFCYPEGDFSESVMSLVKDAGYSGARITNPGLNDQATDPYQLFYLGMNAETSFEAVQKAVDDAIAEKKWLIMVFHRVDETGYENVSAEFLQKTVDYVKEKQVPVVTNAQGLFVVKNIPH